MEHHLTATECHLPYGITQCYSTFHPTQANTPRLHPSPTGWYSIYRPFKDGGLSKPRPRVQRATGPRLLLGSETAGNRTQPTTNNLFSAIKTKYCKQHCICRQQNPQPVERESDAVTITPPSHLQKKHQTALMRRPMHMQQRLRPPATGWLKKVSCWLYANFNES